MKKILFLLVALVASMSMNAQVMKVMKNGEEVAKYTGAEYSVVFEEAQQGSTTTGTAKRTGDIEVNWVQLWENGPKFAEYNVGVTDGKAESYGGYYGWGSYLDKVYFYDTGSYNLSGNHETATNLWGSNWRMPTKAELRALLANCDVEWTTVNGVNGCKFTGKDAYVSNSVFLPAAGRCSDGSVSDQGIVGYYWSSTTHDSPYARYLYFVSGAQGESYVFRGSGHSVRAVLAED